MRYFRLAAFLLLVVLSTLPATCASARADVVTDLYFAQTVVTGTVEPERTRGMREALTEVAIKLTGDPRLAGSPRLAALLEKPADLVQRFEYEDRMKDLPVRDEQGTRERPHFLRVWFEPAKTERALRGLKLRLWSPNRPVVHVFLALRTGKGLSWLAREGDDGALQRLVLIEAARRRGLPVGLPSIESARRLATLVSDPSPKVGMAAIAAATAAPTGASHALIGELRTRPDGYWQTWWSLRFPRRSGKSAVSIASADGVTFDRALKEAIDGTVQILSGHRP